MDVQLRIAFLKAATWHGSIDDANAILSANPSLATHDIFTAATTGNAEKVLEIITADPGLSQQLSEPYGANALVYLCMSKYLRLDQNRSKEFYTTAKILLDAGADANSGFWSRQDHPEFETALYGAAGVAHHPELTALLLEYGADPNDGEVVYHSPETDQNDALKILVETRKINQENLSLMLIRKHDWHDYDGVKYLLENGADPNCRWGNNHLAIHHAIKRCNHIAIIKLLLDHGADPQLVADQQTAIARAAREGRKDVLELLQAQGFPIILDENLIVQLLAYCALGDETNINTLTSLHPDVLQEMIAIGGSIIARFCLSGNHGGVRQLLRLGIDVNAAYKDGDPYFGIPAGSLPLHVAAWMGYAEIVKLLIDAGADVNAVDANRRTPIMLAIHACVDSFWTYRRTTASIDALLKAGASTAGIIIPCGYPEADELLLNASESRN